MWKAKEVYASWHRVDVVEQESPVKLSSWRGFFFLTFINTAPRLYFMEPAHQLVIREFLDHIRRFDAESRRMSPDNCEPRWTENQRFETNTYFRRAKGVGRRLDVWTAHQRRGQLSSCHGRDVEGLLRLEQQFLTLWKRTVSLFEI